MRIDGFPNPPDNDPRYVEMQRLLLVDQDKTLVRGASRVTGEAVAMERALRSTGDPAVPPFPLTPRTSLGNQLEQIAKVISVRNELGMSRQIFFCSLGGFDTHSARVTSATSPETGTHANLLLQVGNSMKAFYDATVQLGVASQVTTFTLSDFSRTWVPNGNLGTDHAWGSHQFVIGGSVLGGEFYGLPGLTEPFFRRSRLMVRMIPMREATQRAAGYQPSPSTSTALPSPLGSVYRTPTLPRYFQTLKDLANPTSVSSPSSGKKRHRRNEF